jgi:hypothetical protein
MRKIGLFAVFMVVFAAFESAQGFTKIFDFKSLNNIALTLIVLNLHM